MRAFLAGETRHGDADPRNQLSRSLIVPAAGIACVATQVAVLINDDPHALGTLHMVGGVTLLANAGTIQVDALTSRTRTGGMRANRLRFPIVPGGKPAHDVQTAWLYRAGLIGNAGAGAIWRCWRWRSDWCWAPSPSRCTATPRWWSATSGLPHS